MYLRKRMAAAAFAFAAATGTALAGAAPAGAAASAGEVVSKRSVNLADCSWHHDTSWGESSGTCSSTWASGWVEDQASDGKCVQVKIEWKLDGKVKDTDYSPKACPDGDRDTFSKKPGDGSHWTADNLDVTTYRS
jgi:hypothetical protein